MVMNDARDHNALVDAIIAELSEKYDLVYVAYDDRLTDEQTAALVAGRMDALWEQTAEAAVQP